MVASMRGWCRWHLMCKNVPQVPQDRVYCRLIYSKYVENADWGCTKAVDTVMWWWVYSCVGNSGKAWVLVKAEGLPGMGVQNFLHGYIVDKSPNRSWSESFCDFQEEWGRHQGVLSSASA